MRWLAGLVASILMPSICMALGPEVMMDCEVNSQSIIASEDGKPKTYSNFKDQFEVGDSLRFTFKPSGKGLYADLLDKSRNSIVMSSISIFEENNTVQKGLDYKNDPFVQWSDEYTKIYYSNDKAKIETVLSTLELRRYYKSDFHGLLVTGDLMSRLLVQVVTLDCRMVKDEFDQILAKFEANVDSD